MLAENGTGERPMKLQDVMVKNVVTVSPDETISAAARIMREQSIGCLVITVDHAIKGILTDRDLLGCITAAHNPSECKVSAHMSRPVIVERPDEELAIAANVMCKYRIKRLPIAVKGNLVGLVSASDIAMIAHDQAENCWPNWSLIAGLIKAQALHQRLPKHTGAAQA